MFKKENIILVMAFFFPLSLVAKNIFANEQRLGSINVYLEESKQAASMENVEFELIKIAKLVNGEYEFIDGLKDIPIDLNSLKNGSELQNGANIILNNVKEKRIAGIRKKTNVHGNVKFSDLEIGVYLLNTSDSNKYDNVSPSIVAIPSFDNNMNYDVDIVPKHSSIIAAKTNDEIDFSDLAMLLGSGVIVVCIKKLKEKPKN